MLRDGVELAMVVPKADRTFELKWKAKPLADSGFDKAIIASKLQNSFASADDSPWTL